MKKDDKLLIGSLSENHNCTYKLDCLERAVGLRMTPLGTEPSSWCLDTRTLGISAAHMVGISVMGTQKLRPKTTLKQHIYDKMNTSPTRANPQLFNLFLGVEISHCTGNARRIRVRDLFSIKTLQSALTNRFPDWMNTNPGLELLAALETPYDDSFIELWRSNAEFRPQIAELLCCILEVLDKSGISGDTFQVGYINHGKECSMSLELCKNNWANLLQDSERTAVYAIINENCLECHARGHSTRQCSSTKAFTVFETRIALDIS